MSEATTAVHPGYPDPRKQARQAIVLGMGMIAVLFGGLGSWLAFAPLHGAVVAPGQVKVESSRKTVQHLEGGLVSEILVKEGDLVKAGQPLIVLESTQVDAQYNMLRDQLDAELAHAARLTAEKNGASRIAFPAELMKRGSEAKVADSMRNETRIFETRRETLNGEIGLIRSQIAEVQGEIVHLDEQLKASGKSINYLNDELTANETLAKKGFVSAPKVLELKRALSEQEDKQGEYSANIARAKQKTAELQLRIASLKDDYAKQASDELKKSQDQVFDLQERLRVPEDAMKRQTIAAPVEGRVVDLKVHTVGGVIAAREPLMDIVPVQSSLIIESKVKVDDIDDLQMGMGAEVRLSAFKQRITPLVKGKVVYISADSLIDETTHVPYYKMHVQVDSASLKEAGNNIGLYPGMPAEVYVITQERTALEYLLQPVTDTLRRAFREP
jgi:HlyD family secretion protein/epimerase transport system membrane fusion protein